MKKLREDHFDRNKWNQKYREKSITDFPPSALFTDFSGKIPLAELPEGDVLELACGVSGTALKLARQGRRVLAADVSDVGLAQLSAEIEKRGLGDRIDLLQADLVSWSAPRRDFALVICSFYWDRTVFGYAHDLVMPGGILAWEGFSPLHLKYKPDSKHAMGKDEPLSLLPKSFTVIECRDVDDGHAVSRRLIAKREP
uniref:Methyltransferase domain-containing protein n=1 Tax=Candidatus Kentrum sp. LPFa TaxID=2126335 RepID=A0A450WB74_9GAMM|nr:MAG: Methyltransferase domain-containing protein [Candidatus Kentron sp. LPFa]VFK30167.1 MAG: Methyltransferase domain-containing protein [Candidatus Kentron sp. LPFa]